jgi:hypothetical protein
MLFIRQINENSIRTYINPQKSLSVVIDTDEAMKNYNKKLREKFEFYNYVKKHPNVDKWLKFYETSAIYDKSIIDYNKIFKINETSVNKSAINVFCVNRDYLTLLSKNVAEGRTYNNADIKNLTKFNSDLIKNNYISNEIATIPVIAGSSFKKVHKLNDIIETKPFGNSTIVKYKIIGFLKKDTLVLNEDFAYFTFLKKNFNNSLIVLDADINPDKLNMRLSDKADYYTNLIHHSILLLKNYDADKTKNEIINKEKELNLFVIIKSYNDTMNDFFKEVHPIISYETVKNSIMLVFCLIGLIGSIFSLMNDNKKELGILVSIGVNNTKLTLIYSLQYLVFFILSYLSGILISFKIDETVFASGLKNTFTIFNIGTTFLVIIIILLLIVILLNKTLKRCLPVDLIGGFREWV